MTKKGTVFVSKEELIADILEVYNKLGKVNTPLYKKHGKYGEYYIFIYGGIKKLMRETGIGWTSHRKIDRRDLMLDAMRVFKEHGSLKKELYEKHGLHSCTAIRGEFGSFNNLLKELGLKININRNPKKEEMAERCMELYNQYGFLTSKLQREESGYSQVSCDRGCLVDSTVYSTILG